MVEPITPGAPNPSAFNDPANPLLNPVEDKLHGHKEVGPENQDKLYTPIPEQTFQRPKVDFGQKPGAPPIPGQPPMPGAEPPLTDAEKNQRAEAAVKMALRFYEDAHKVAGWVLKPNEKKIAARVNAGELDNQRVLQIGLDGAQHNLNGVIQHTNDRVDEVLKVTEKFKREITPPLSRIAMKNGWGVSDEFTVGEMVLRDVIVKGSMLWAINQSLKQILEALTIVPEDGDPTVKRQTQAAQPPPRPPQPPTATTQGAEEMDPQGGGGGGQQYSEPHYGATQPPPPPPHQDFGRQYSDQQTHVEEIVPEDFDGYNANKQPADPYPTTAQNDAVQSPNVVIVEPPPARPENKYYKRKTDRVYRERKKK